MVGNRDFLPLYKIEAKESQIRALPSRAGGVIWSQSLRCSQPSAQHIYYFIKESSNKRAIQIPVRLSTTVKQEC